MNVKNVIISEQGTSSDNYREFTEIAEKRKCKIIRAKMKDRLMIEKDIYLDFLWPNNKNMISEKSLNNNSIVCKLNYKSFSMLFTGDIENIAEEGVINEYGEAKECLEAVVIKIAHHGSKTSTSKRFIELVKPKIAVIGVGKKNKFGHPNSEVLERLDNLRCDGL